MTDFALQPWKSPDGGGTVGYSHYVRFSAHLNATSIFVWLWRQEWALAALSGVDAAGVPTVAVGFEAPVPFSVPRSKKGMELLHVERFRIDCAARGQGLRIDDLSYSKGGDDEKAPDFVVEIGGRSLGLECTTYALEERRDALGLLEPIRASMRKRGRRAFRRLHGMVVYLGFPHAEDPDGAATGLPFPRSQPQLIEELVDLIADHRPSPGELLTHGPMPEHAPDIGLTFSTAGASVHAVPLAAGHVPSPFMHEVGLEISVMFTTVHSLDRERDRLAQLVRSKDKPGKDFVLITAGGPDRAGAIHPAEELAAGLVLDDTEPIVCSFAQRVLLHRWWYGDVWEIFPERRRVVPGPARPARGGLTYPSLVVPSHLWVARNDVCPCGSQRKFKACHGAG